MGSKYAGFKNKMKKQIPKSLGKRLKTLDAFIHDNK